MRPVLAILTLSLTATATAASGWLADASRAPDPTGRAVGRIHGEAFVVERAELSVPRREPGSAKASYFLTLRQGKDFFSDREFWISFITRPGEKLEGKRWDVTPAGVFKMPGGVVDGNVTYPPIQGIIMRWKNKDAAGRDSDLTSGYTMRLEFGKRTGNKIAGRIHLAMKDQQKSWVAGTFFAEVKPLP